MDKLFSLNLPEEFMPFWFGTHEKQLRFPKCSDCRKFHWYPHKSCPHCQSSNISWEEVNPLGELFSWTIVRHAFDDDLKNKIPFIVGLIIFKDAPGVRLVTEIIQVEKEKLEIGMTLEPVFRKITDNRTLVLFKPYSSNDQKPL